MAEQELVEVYRAKDSPQAHILKFALENAGIGTVIEGDMLQAAMGEVPMGWSGAPRIMVEGRDATRAREIIAQNERAGATASTNSGKSHVIDACLACGAPMPEKEERCPGCGWTYTNDEKDR